MLGLLLFGCSTNESSTSVDANEESNEKDQEVIELTLGHVLSENSHFQAGAVAFKEEVEKRTNGEIKINIFPQGQLGGEVEMVQGTVNGNQDFCMCSQPAYSNIISELSIFDLPYLFDNLEQANRVTFEIGDTFFELLDQHNLVGLTWVSAMERSVFGSKPIYEAEDLKGLKFRVVQAPGYVKAYESLGVQPTPTAYSELYMAMQQGVVDAADLEPIQYVEDKFIEVSDYYSLTKVHYLPSFLSVNANTFNQLSEEHQEAIKEAAKIAGEASVSYYEEAYSEALQKIEDAGVEIVETNIESLKVLAQSVYDSLIQDIPNGEELFDLIQSAK